MPCCFSCCHFVIRLFNIQRKVSKNNFDGVVLVVIDGVAEWWH